jgi:hypothetical protein
MVVAVVAEGVTVVMAQLFRLVEEVITVAAEDLNKVVSLETLVVAVQ